jgi:hypothetical protein
VIRFGLQARFTLPRAWAYLATYKQVIQRDAAGVMSPSGVYQCTGCHLLFRKISEWRHGPVPQQLVKTAVPPHLAERAPG